MNCQKKNLKGQKHNWKISYDDLKKRELKGGKKKKETTYFLNNKYNRKQQRNISLTTYNSVYYIEWNDL